MEAGTVAVEVAQPQAADTPSAREQRLLQAASRRVGGIHCVLDHLEDRGNRAAILRTIEALGLLHVHEVSPAEPERGRARGVAHGGEKWLMLHSHSTAAACREALRGVRLLAALPPAHQVSTSWHSLGSRRRRKRGSEEQAADEPAPPPAAPPPPLPAALAEPVALEDIDFSTPVALAFGNERLGLSHELLALCDGAFHIPLAGLTESLNVSVATAVALHHGRLQRTAALRRAALLNQHGGDMDEAQVAALLAEYATRGKDYAKGGAASEDAEDGER
jgi:tRNA (guanosine-2'-O-)-methyltransferase